MDGKTGKGAEAWRRYVEFLGARGPVLELRGAKLQNLLYGNYEKAGGTVDRIYIAIHSRLPDQGCHFVHRLLCALTLRHEVERGL